MRKRAKRWIGAIALGVLGASGVIVITKKKRSGQASDALTSNQGDVWARPGMLVTFRAELKPGRERSERTFRVQRVLPRGRVLLDGAVGEHTEKEFEPIRF